VFRFSVAAMGALLALAACVSDQPDPNDPMGRTPAELAAARTACVADGGTFRPAGLGILTCIHSTSDAGQSCLRASDCEGVCIGTDEGGICSGAYPVFGCYARIDDDGNREPEICVD